MIATTKSTRTMSSIVRRLFVITFPLETDRAAFVRRPVACIAIVPRALGEVVADVAEDVLDLAAEEDHRDDHGDGDDCDDEFVVDQALAFVVVEKCMQSWIPLVVDLGCMSSGL